MYTLYMYIFSPLLSKTQLASLTCIIISHVSKMCHDHQALSPRISLFRDESRNEKKNSFASRQLCFTYTFHLCLLHLFIVLDIDSFQDIAFFSPLYKVPYDICQHLLLFFLTYKANVKVLNSFWMRERVLLFNEHQIALKIIYSSFFWSVPRQKFFTRDKKK